MSAPLLIPEPPLQVLRGLARAIGLNQAIVLQQVHYRQNQSEAALVGGWLRRTYAEWHRTDFPFWSSRTIERIFDSLRAANLLIVETGDGTDRALRYRINYEAVPSRQFVGMDHDNLTRQSDGMSMKKKETSTPNGVDTSLLSEQAQEVFDHWCDVHGKNGNTTFGPKRKRAVTARLKEPNRDVAYLKRAVDGNAKSKWHCDRGLNELELVMRNEVNIEKFEALAHEPDGSEHQQQVAEALARGPAMSDEDADAQLASVGLAA